VVSNPKGRYRNEKVCLTHSQYGVEIPWENVRDLLQYAVFLCFGDFDEFLGDTIDGIKAELGID